MEELLGLEPRIKDLQSNALSRFAIAPDKPYKYENEYDFLKRIINNGREQGIRTLGGVNLAGFQNRYIRPTLSTLYLYYNGANDRN